MLVAIHQPNFFPWLGYFHKVHISDKFVILDDVQLVKKGGSYTQRVNISIQGQSKYLHVDIQRPSGTILIKDVEFVNMDWHQKFLKTLEYNYKKHPHFSTYYPDLVGLCSSAKSLCELNISFIYYVTNLFGIDSTKISKSSELNIQTSATQRLIDITKAVGGNSYLEGGGAAGYQEDELFKDQGIELQKQSFIHPKYSQRKMNEFCGGLSILDAFFNIGHAETLKLIKSV